MSVMTREERELKINAICDEMDNWDLETLLDWAKGARAAILVPCSDEELQDVYEEDVLNKG